MSGVRCVESPPARCATELDRRRFARSRSPRQLARCLAVCRQVLGDEHPDTMLYQREHDRRRRTLRPPPSAPDPAA